MKAGLAAAALAVLLGLGVGIAKGASASPYPLASHTALYRMSLATANLSGGVIGASGRMDYQFADSCDGWVTKTKTDITFSYNDGDPAETSWNMLSWESKDGLHYRFHVRSLRNGEPSEEIEGRADLDGPGKSGVVHFTLPEERMIRLPKGTMFPTDQTVRLLQAAQKNRHYVNWPLFDGSEADGPYDVGIILGRELPANANTSPAEVNKDVDANLLTPLSWRLQMAYFTHDSDDPTPDYESAMRLYQNGVAEDVLQSFGDFSLRGTLVTLKILPRPDC